MHLVLHLLTALLQALFCSLCCTPQARLIVLLPRHKSVRVVTCAIVLLTGGKLGCASWGGGGSSWLAGMTGLQPMCQSLQQGRATSMPTNNDYILSAALGKRSCNVLR